VAAAVSYLAILPPVNDDEPYGDRLVCLDSIVGEWARRRRDVFHTPEEVAAHGGVNAGDASARGGRGALAPD
jgi:hypothetical protein